MQQQRRQNRQKRRTRFVGEIEDDAGRSPATSTPPTAEKRGEAAMVEVPLDSALLAHKYGHSPSSNDADKSDKDEERAVDVGSGGGGGGGGGGDGGGGGSSSETPSRRLPRLADGQPATIAALLVRTGVLGIGPSSPAAAALIHAFDYDDEEEANARRQKKHRSKREITREASRSDAHELQLNDSVRRLQFSKGLLKTMNPQRKPDDDNDDSDEDDGADNCIFGNRVGRRCADGEWQLDEESYRFASQL